LVVIGSHGFCPHQIGREQTIAYEVRFE
jgi:hypothetical protein